VDELVTALVAVAMVVGLLGTILPLVPGLPLIWGGGLAYGLLQGFTPVGWVAFAAMSLILLGALVAKIVVPKRRAGASGAPTSSVVAGAVAGLIGFFAVPVVGLPLGAVVGVLLAERRRTGDWAAARKTTKEVVIGFGIGAVVEFGAGVAMFGCWVAWVALTT
jgi:uncharacterized protein